MTQETAEKMVAEHGGKNWLKNMLPETLFRFFKGEYRGKMETMLVDADDSGGWAIFTESLNSGKKQVLAIFYKKGELPSFYPGRLKKDPNLGWILVDELLEFEDPRVADFRRKVLLEVIKESR